MRGLFHAFIQCTLAEPLARTRSSDWGWDLRSIRHNPAPQTFRDLRDLFVEAGKEAENMVGWNRQESPVLGVMLYEGGLRDFDFPRILVLTGEACGLRKSLLGKKRYK